LFRVRGSVGEIYANTAKNYGLALSDSKINESFKKAFAEAPPLCFPEIPKEASKVTLEYKWWEDLVGNVISPKEFKNENEFKLFFGELYNIFSKKNTWEIYDDVLPFLNKLKGNSYRLGIISNFDSRLHQILEILEIKNYFEVIVCSSEIGFAKPQKEIFLQSIPSDIKKSEVAMIGDHFDLDITPAKALGLEAFWIQRHPKTTPLGMKAYKTLLELPLFLQPYEFI